MYCQSALELLTRQSDRASAGDADTSPARTTVDGKLAPLRAQLGWWLGLSDSPAELEAARQVQRATLMSALANDWYLLQQLAGASDGYAADTSSIAP